MNFLLSVFGRKLAKNGGFFKKSEWIFGQKIELFLKKSWLEFFDFLKKPSFLKSHFTDFSDKLFAKEIQLREQNSILGFQNY